MRELSVFVDESGTQEGTSEYYLVTLVFHDQEDVLQSYLAAYEHSLRERGLPDIPFHAEPLMRAHGAYTQLTPSTRHQELVSFSAFVRRLPVHYVTFSYRSDNVAGREGLLLSLKRDIINYLFDHLEYFQRFDQVKIYYDNGQPTVTGALHAAMEYVLSRGVVVYRSTGYQKYRLSQVADYVCMVELAALKYVRGEATETDKRFFGLSTQFKKNYLKQVRRKLLN